MRVPYWYGTLRRASSSTRLATSRSKHTCSIASTRCFSRTRTATRAEGSRRYGHGCTVAALTNFECSLIPTPSLRSRLDTDNSITAISCRRRPGRAGASVPGRPKHWRCHTRLNRISRHTFGAYAGRRRAPRRRSSTHLTWPLSLRSSSASRAAPAHSSSTALPGGAASSAIYASMRTSRGYARGMLGKSCLPRSDALPHRTER